MIKTVTGVVRAGNTEISFRIVRRVPLDAGVQIQAIIDEPTRLEPWVNDAHSFSDALSRLGERLDYLIRQLDDR